MCFYGFESHLLRICPKVPPYLNTMAINPKGSLVFFPKPTFFVLTACNDEKSKISDVNKAYGIGVFWMVINIS